MATKRGAGQNETSDDARESVTVLAFHSVAVFPLGVGLLRVRAPRWPDSRRRRGLYTSQYANVHRGLHYLANKATEGYEGAREQAEADNKPEFTLWMVKRRPHCTPPGAA